MVNKKDGPEKWRRNLDRAKRRSEKKQSMLNEVQQQRQLLRSRVFEFHKAGWEDEMIAEKLKIQEAEVKSLIGDCLREIENLMKNDRIH